MRLLTNLIIPLLLLSASQCFGVGCNSPALTLFPTEESGGDCISGSIVFGNPNVQSTGYAISGGVIIWTKWSAIQSCDVDAVERYAGVASTTDTAMAVYADNGAGTGPSGSPLAATSEITATNVPLIWENISLSSSFSAVLGTTYWIAMWADTDSGGTGFRTYRDTTGGTNCYLNTAGNIGTWPDGSVAMCVGGTQLFSVRAVVQ